MEIVKAEMPIPVQKTTEGQPILKANESIRMIPNGSTLVEYASHMEQREFSVTIQYVFQDRRESHNFLDHVMNNCSRLEALIHDNITLTLADSSLAYNITMGVMTYSAEVEEYDDYHIVEWELSCTHSGNAN